MTRRSTRLARAVWAMVCLAWAFWRRQLRRVVTAGRDDGGPERFLANYAHEGMVPMSVTEERLIEGLGRCIRCGLCEVVCPQPLDRWINESRATDMAAHAVAGVVERPCADGCTRCEAICPAGVPLAGVVGYLRDRARTR